MQIPPLNFEIFLLKTEVDSPNKQWTNNTKQLLQPLVREGLRILILQYLLSSQIILFQNKHHLVETLKNYIFSYNTADIIITSEKKNKKIKLSLK